MLISTIQIPQKMMKHYRSHQSHQNLQNRHLSVVLAPGVPEEALFSLPSFLPLLNIITQSPIILGFVFTSPGALISGITSLDPSIQKHETYLIFRFRCPGRSFAEKCILRLPTQFKPVPSLLTSRQVSSCGDISISRRSASGWWPRWFVCSGHYRILNKQPNKR